LLADQGLQHCEHILGQTFGHDELFRDQTLSAVVFGLSFLRRTLWTFFFVKVQLLGTPECFGSESFLPVEGVPAFFEVSVDDVI